MTPLILASILLAILVLSGTIWLAIRRVHYINNDRAEIDKRLRNISR